MLRALPTLRLGGASHRATQVNTRSPPHLAKRLAQTGDAPNDRNHMPSRPPKGDSRRSSYRISHLPHLVAQWHPWRNGDLRPEDVTYGSGKRVWWRCAEGPDHEWATPACRRGSSGAGCPYCANQRLSVTNSLAARAPEIAAEWHPLRNGGTRPRDLIAGTARKYWWRCAREPDHEWLVSPAKRLEGHGCPYCANVLVARSNCLATRRPELAAQWHPSRNGKLRPTDVVAGSTRRVWWRCPEGIGHSWQTTCHARATMSEGCPFCAQRKVARDNTLRACFPAIAAEWHPTKNRALGPGDVVAGSKRKVWWRCSVDGRHAWQASVHRRTRNGTGCPVCAGRAVSRATSLASVAPRVAAQWHPTRNGGVTPREIPSGSGKSFWWRCPAARGHVWRAAVHRRVEGSGCPFCRGRRPPHGTRRLPRR